MSAPNRFAVAVLLLGTAAPIASARPAFSYVNPDLGLYGMIDQKDVRMNPALPNIMPEFGRWSCGPTSLTNSLGYLQRKFDAFYTDGTGARTLVPGLNLNPVVNPAADKAALLQVASDLASAAYMDQSKGIAPPAQSDPYRRDYSPSQNDGTTPNGGDTGGVTWERFAFGKDCWFKPVADGGSQPNRSWLDGQYRNQWDPSDIPTAPGWLKTNVALDPELMFSRLRIGADVELGFSWIGAAGGHFVTVFGYSLTLDVNGNNKFDPGDTALLNILDPWGAPIFGSASITSLTLTQPVAAGAVNIQYDANLGAAFGAAALPSGEAKLWASEIPAPGTLTLLTLAGALGVRRRRASARG